jgi:hypothetical protein
VIPALLWYPTVVPVVGKQSTWNDMTESSGWIPTAFVALLVAVERKLAEKGQLDFDADALMPWRPWDGAGR